MDFVKAITACLCGTEHEYTNVTNDEKTPLVYETQPNQSLKPFLSSPSAKEARQAEEFLDALFKTGSSKALHRQFSSTSWTEQLAGAILNGLVEKISNGQELNGILGEAYDKAKAAAEECIHWVQDHEKEIAIVVLVLIAIGILVIIAPWVIEALGFAAEGPVADSFAAMWQARYLGYVPKGSLFSFFQRLGMINTCLYKTVDREENTKLLYENWLPCIKSKEVPPRTIPE